MNEEEKRTTELEQQEEAAETLNTAESPAGDAADAEKRAEMEEVARNVVNEAHEQWEIEKRQRRRKKRKWTLIIMGIVIAVLAVVVYVRYFAEPQREQIVVNEETIPVLCPIDEEAAARIDAMEGYSPEDTWTFYLYMVGSDLEAGTSNQLSDLVRLQTTEEAQTYQAEVSQRNRSYLLQLSEEISAQGLELPYTMYAPQSDLDQIADEEAAPSVTGCATQDLLEYMSVPLPENVRFVIQTGGAPAWADPNVNPNRSQRFLLDSNGLKEIYNGPVCNMADQDTLVDFLKFGVENYPADHQAVIFWNHGGADTGFGSDRIYGGDLLTLPELREAFSSVFTLDPENPPLELIYFASCLMSNADVLEYMEGTTKYMVAAEEVTFGFPDQGACKEWLEQFVENTGINGAQLGKLMVDSYMNSVLRFAEDQGIVLPTTLNLIDMHRAGEVYDAYGKFAQAALKAQIEDPAMIRRVADAAGSSVFLGNYAYAEFNLIDLPLFMEGVAEYFPEEAKAVLDVVDEVMMYKRATEYLKDAGGISVHYPYHLDDIYAIARTMGYIDTVSTSMDINAMYYYKMTGCMNDVYQKYCEDAGYGTAEALRYEELYRLRDVKVELDEKGDMSLVLTDLEDLLLQDAVYELMKVDEEVEEITYLGEERYANFGSKQLTTEFPVSWVTIDGVPFALEIINTDDEDIQYSTRVVYRDMDKYLILNYNFETEEMSILGLRDPAYDAATLDRSVEPLDYNEKITPVYKVTDLNGGNVHYDTADSAKYKNSSNISDATLEDGTYIARIKMEDMRSDRYYSEPIRLIVENGKVTEAMPEKEYRVVGYH